MEYKNFTDRQIAFDGFVKYRREVYDSIDDGKFFDVFTELCSKAMLGDCIAQDCVAYFYKKGVPDFLLPNFNAYMSWQILAGAGGNEFAIEKMEFFLQNAINEIIYDEETMQMALIRGNITSSNALMVISNLICEGIADELQLDPKSLIHIDTSVASPYSPDKNRLFLNAMEKCMSSVRSFLVS